MQNFSTAVDATNTALNSAGSATEENERAMQSLERRLSNVKSTFQDFANNVISSELVGALLDLANVFLKLLNTPIGSFITQVTLLTGAMWGLQAVIKAMNIFGVIKTQVMALPALFSALTGAINGTTTATTLFGAASKAAFPILGLVSLALAAIVAIAPKVSDWYKEVTNDVEYATEKLNENKSVLEQNKQRLEELNSVPMSNRTWEIQSEIDKLREENKELQENIDKWSEKQLRGKIKEVLNTPYDLTPGKQIVKELDGFLAGWGEVQDIVVKTSDGIAILADTTEEAVQKLKEAGIVSKDYKGSLEELGYTLKETTADSLIGVEKYEKIIELQEDFTKNVLEGAEVTAEEIDEYDKRNTILNQYVELLQQLPVEELNDKDKELIETIIQLSSQYDTVIGKMYSAEASINLLTQGAGLNEVQFKQLIAVYPQLANALTEANGLYILNQESLYDLAAAGDEMARSLIKAQISATENTIANIKQRISMYQTELQALQAYTNAQNSVLKIGSTTVKNPANIAAGVIETILGGAITSQTTELDKQQNLLNQLKNQVASWSPSSAGLGSVGGGGSSSGGSGGSSSGGSQKDPIEEQNDLFKEQNDILEHNIFLREKQGATNNELIQLNKQYQQQITQQANWFRQQGLSEDSEYIRDAQKQWWSLQDEITDLMQDNFDERLELSEEYIEEKNKLDNWGADSEVEAWKRVLAWMDDWYKQGLIDYEYYIEQRKKAEDELFDAQRTAFDDRLQLSKDYIEDRNNLNDWGADSEIASWKRVLKWMDEWYQQGLIDYAYYIEERQEATDSLIQAEKEALEQLISDYETAFSYMANKIDEELQKLYEKQDAYEKLADYMVSQIDKEIDKLEEQKDAEEAYWDEKIEALEKQNEALNEQIEKEEALDALARAKQSKVMVYKDGRFQYVEDTQLVSDAQLKLEQIKREEEYKEQIEALEQQKEQAIAVIDEQIEYWNKYREEWSSLVDDYIEEQNKLLIEQQLGIKLEGENWKDRVDQFDDFNEEYKDLLDNQIGKLEDYKDEWSSVVSDYQENQDKLIAEQILGISLEGENWKTRLDNLQDYVNRYNELMGQLESGGYVDTEVGGGNTGGSQGSSGTATATIPNQGKVTVTISNDKVQDEGLPLGTIIHTAGGDYMIVGGKGGAYQSVPVGKNEWSADEVGNAPDKAQIGDLVNTAGGKYVITPTGVGTYNPSSGFWSLPYSAYAYAKGTKSAVGGFSLVGEQGPELRVLNQGDGVLPNKITQNLWNWGSLTPADMMTSINGLLKQGADKVTSIIIENFAPNLSNVTNGQDFADYLKNNFVRSVVQFQGT